MATKGFRIAQRAPTLFNHTTKKARKSQLTQTLNNKRSPTRPQALPEVSSQKHPASTTRIHHQTAYNHPFESDTIHYSLDHQSGTEFWLQRKNGPPGARHDLFTHPRSQWAITRISSSEPSRTACCISEAGKTSSTFESQKNMQSNKRKSSQLWDTFIPLEKQSRPDGIVKVERDGTRNSQRCRGVRQKEATLETMQSGSLVFRQSSLARPYQPAYVLLRYVEILI